MSEEVTTSTDTGDAVEGVQETKRGDNSSTPTSGMSEESKDLIEEFSDSYDTDDKEESSTLSETTQEANDQSVTEETKTDAEVLQESIEDGINYDNAIEAIKGDTEFMETFTTAVDLLPQDVIDDIQGNSSYLDAIVTDVKNGKLVKLMPHVNRLMESTDMTFLDAYSAAEKAMVNVERKRGAMAEKRKLIEAEPTTTGMPQPKSVSEMTSYELDQYIDSF